jgi:GNAT superfamily N-acetyltransferase
VGLRGYRGLWCFRRGGRVVVSAPPAWVGRLEELWAGWDRERLLDPAAVAASLGEDCDRCIGPAFQGSIDPAGFRERTSPEVRAVLASDRPGIERLRDRCGDEAWGGLNDVGTLAYVHPHGTEIAAMAGLRERSDGVGDPCVVTDPRFRGEGRGRAVVSAVTRDALASGYLVLYQTLESNRAAVRLAMSLGFARYGNHLAVRLNHDTPRVPGGSTPA